jgi:RNA polymerase sigma-70 factor (ECF subfamily)
MSERSTEQIRELLDSLYRVDSGRILATLIRLLGDFDLAEEAMHEAFAAALSLWPRSGTRQPTTMVNFDGPIQSH